MKTSTKAIISLAGILLAATATTSMTGCRGGGSSDEAAAPVEIARYDLAVEQYPSLDSARRAKFRSDYEAVDRIVLPLFARHSVDSAQVDSLLKAYAESRTVKMFGAAVNERVSSLDSLERVIGAMEARGSQLLPSLRWPRLYGVISPYGQSIILDGDSTALIGLNHYLGADHAAYQGFEEYLRREKELPRLPAQLTEALIESQLPYTLTGQDATLLSAMLHSGAVAYTTMRLADIDEATLLGWTPQQLQWARDNESQAWDALIRRRMLYSTDTDMALRLTRRAPSSSALHPDSPGRMGTWIGLRIVQAYLNRRPDTTPADLLNKNFYGDIQSLITAGYAP